MLRESSHKTDYEMISRKILSRTDHGICFAVPLSSETFDVQDFLLCQDPVIQLRDRFAMFLFEAATLAFDQLVYQRRHARFQHGTLEFLESHGDGLSFLDRPLACQEGSHGV